MIIWILLRFCYWDSVTILTLVIFLDIGILHLKEIEFVPSFSTLNHHLIIFGEDDDDDGDDGDDDDDDALDDDLGQDHLALKGVLEGQVVAERS